MGKNRNRITVEFNNRDYCYGNYEVLYSLIRDDIEGIELVKNFRRSIEQNYLDFNFCGIMLPIEVENGALKLKMEFPIKIHYANELSSNIRIETCFVNSHKLTQYQEHFFQIIDNDGVIFNFAFDKEDFLKCKNNWLDVIKKNLENLKIKNNYKCESIWKEIKKYEFKLRAKEFFSDG